MTVPKTGIERKKRRAYLVKQFRGRRKLVARSLKAKKHCGRGSMGRTRFTTTSMVINVFWYGVYLMEDSNGLAGLGRSLYEYLNELRLCSTWQ